MAWPCALRVSQCMFVISYPCKVILFMCPCCPSVAVQTTVSSQATAVQHWPQKNTNKQKKISWHNATALIGCLLSNAKLHSPEPQGSAVTPAAPLSTNNGQFIFVCDFSPVSMYFTSPGFLPFTLSPPPHFHFYTLSFKSLSFPFLPFTKLHQLLAWNRLFCMFFILFSPNVTLAVEERIIAGNYFIHF